MGRLDYQGYIAQLQECKPLEERDMKALCEVVKSQLLEEANVQAVSSPVTVCGDIHGQLWDLLELLKLATGGTYSTEGCGTRFVFMGDYVDRGAHSLETLSLLLVLKARSPELVTLLRGNHESRHITQVYGFYDECIHKYGNADVWKACCAVFDLMSVAAVVDGDVLCVHGGLSPALRTLDEVRVLARAQEIPQEGAFCDLMWSDPEDIEGWAVSPRGAGWLFGQRVVDEFARLNGLRLIARAHQLVHEGYRYMFGERLVTVWSAPNYCYRCGNVASMMHLNHNTETFTVFDAAPAHSTPPRHGFSACQSMLIPRQTTDDSRHWTPESDDSPQSWKASLATSTVIPCVITFAVIALVICLLSLRFYVICRRGYPHFSWHAFFIPRSGISCLGVSPPPPPPPRLNNDNNNNDTNSHNNNTNINSPRRHRFRSRPSTNGPSIAPGGRRLDAPDPDDHLNWADADALPEYKRIDTSLPLYTPPLCPEPIYTFDNDSSSYQHHHAASSRLDLATTKADDLDDDQQLSNNDDDDNQNSTNINDINLDHTSIHYGNEANENTTTTINRNSHTSHTNV